MRDIFYLTRSDDRRTVLLIFPRRYLIDTHQNGLPVGGFSFARSEIWQEFLDCFPDWAQEDLQKFRDDSAEDRLTFTTALGTAPDAPDDHIPAPIWAFFLRLASRSDNLRPITMHKVYGCVTHWLKNQR